MIKDFFFGKLKRETFDLVKATAVITMEDGTQHSVQRVGCIAWPFGRPWLRTGKDFLDGYLFGEKTILVSDHGQYIPVHKIEKIQLYQEELLETHEWRD